MNDQDRAAQVWDDACNAHPEIRITFTREYQIWKEKSDKSIEIIAAYGQERFRVGVEAMRDALIKGPRMLHAEQAKWINDEADKLLAEQEKK